MKNQLSGKAILLIAVFIVALFPRLPAKAAEKGALPPFSDFVQSVTDGKPQMVMGVYVPDVLALKIVQQPEDNPGFVLAEDGTATQFRAAAANGIIGLLAHNTLAGAIFSDLTYGQEVRIIHGNGHVAYYVIRSIARFKADEPESTTSTFWDLQTNIQYTAAQVFNRFYQGSDRVTFQTCILGNGNPSWGRLFVTAVRVSPDYFNVMDGVDKWGLPMDFHSRIVSNPLYKTIHPR